MVGSKAIALLTVRIKNGKAEVVDFGAKGLAEKLQQFEASYKSNNERILVRNTFLAKDFIAPQFTAHCGKKANELISLNVASTALLNPIGSQIQLSIKPTAFATATVNAK